MGLRRRGPDESWNIARSTRQVTISPKRTEAWPAARAINFWARDCAVMAAPYSGFAPENLTTLAQRVISLWTKRLNSSGLLPTGM